MAKNTEIGVDIKLDAHTTPTSATLASYANIQLMIASGMVSARYDGDTTIDVANTNAYNAVVARFTNTTNGIAALTKYMKILLGRSTGVLGARYDGDLSVDNALNTAYNAVLALMT